MKWTNIIALTLVIVGALNWGLIGFLNFDLVTTLFNGSLFWVARVIFLFLWGIIGYFMRKYATNLRFSCIMLHIPMAIAVILSLFPKIPSAIEETLLIVIMSTGFWSVLPRLIVNELWFFMLFYLAVMVLSWYIGYKLAEWKIEVKL